MRLSWGAGIVLIGLLSGVLECPQAGKNPSVVQKKPEAVTAKLTIKPLTEEELKAIKPNELGEIPILEYHDIADREKYMIRHKDKFRADLQRLYEEGYVPIKVEDFLNGHIDVPAGKSPVIITFDDARRTQFKYLKDGSLDPDCGIAIMEAFTKKHPDFPLHAMFFVLPLCAFEQQGKDAEKLAKLLEMGCEIGNHTVHHKYLRHASDAVVQAEIGGCAQILKKLVPQAKVDTFAFPGGMIPRNRSLAMTGEYKGETYTNRAAFLAYGEPAKSPFSTIFDVRGIHRIIATEQEGGSTYWLNQLKNGNVPRYISDGDPETVTFPQKYEKRLNAAAVKAAGLNIRPYDLGDQKQLAKTSKTETENKESNPRQ